MGSDQRERSSGFLVKQAILLLMTIILVVFFAIPLLKAVSMALNPVELKANLDKANEALAGIETKLEVVRTRMLMAPGDNQTQEKLQKETEHLTGQMAMLTSKISDLQLAEALRRPNSPGFWSRLPELVMKVLGFLGSLLSTYTFVTGWWKNRALARALATQ